MKILLTALLLVSGLPWMVAEADPNDPPYANADISNQYDETHQNNHSFNSPSSSMSNVQINPWGNAHDYFGDGVSCSKPSVNVGIAGGERPHRTMAYASINIPLGSKACKEVAQTRKLTMEYQLQQMKAEQHKADVLFASKMASMCIQINEQVSINEENPLYGECKQYVKWEPAPDELAKLSMQWNRTTEQTDSLHGRVERLEGVAHKPNETFLLREVQ